MRQFVKRIALLMLTAILCLAPCCLVFADTSSSEDERGTKLSDDYYIESLHINIEVNEDNSFYITERYIYNFKKPHHGPIRSIPLRHVRTREDGSTSNIKAAVYDFIVQSPDASSEIADTETQSIGDSTYIIYYIGEQDKTYSGKHSYTIRYKYRILTKDPLEGKDELYFNIVGTSWDCPVGNVMWTIGMPKEFAPETIGYSVGGAKTSGYDEECLESSVKGNTISGSYSIPLKTGEGITIRCELPEGYFVHNNYAARIIIFSVLTFIPFVIILVAFKNRKEPVPVVTFYPPESVNPLDAEKIVMGGRIWETISLLPYLADKGYISITETNCNEFTFELVNDNLEGLKECERMFIEGMFRIPKKGCMVTSKDLENSFYTTSSRIQSSYSKKKDIYTDKSLLLELLIKVSGFVAATLFTWIMCSSIYPALNMEEAFIALISVCTFTFLGSLLIGNKAKGKKIITVLRIIAAILFVFTAVFMNSTICPVFLYEFEFCSFILLSSRKVRKWKPEQLMLAGQVFGYMEFIETAELDRLKMLCEEDPDYYYHTMAYAYAFGLEEKWMEKFKNLEIDMHPPVWYTGYGTSMFECKKFNDSFSYMMRSSYKAMTSSPESKSSGSGSSGGSITGGGSGGGGGGAW